MKISWGERLFQPSRISFYINRDSRNPITIYETSAVRVFMFISIFYLSDRWSLKKENDNNSMKT